MSGRRVAAVVAAVLLAAACGGDDDGDDSAGGGDDEGGLSATTSEGGAGGNGGGGGLAGIDVALTPVLEAERPTALVTRPGTDALYVAELEGRVREVTVTGTGAERTYEPADEPLLDISDRVVPGSGPGDERGLLDVTFSPDGATLYVHYSVVPDGDTLVESYPVTGDTIDPDTATEVLTLEQPAPNHNGGDVEFGPDGFLYVALGDGGGAGDPDGHAQDTDDLLGKVLRLDPANPSEGRGYGIPEGNPFADGEGGAPEVWLYGVRNPWRIAFAPGSGDLWVADVGQNEWEEIDLLPAADGGGGGANLGWNAREGTHEFESDEPPDGAVEPVYEYSHDEGCSITGGVVYQGPSVPELAGAYLFADYCAGVLRAVRAEGGEVVDAHVFEDATAEEVVSFGVDAGGDAYVVSGGGDILRIDPAS